MPVSRNAQWTQPILILLAMSLLVGCASTKIGTVRDESARVRLQKPVQVQIYDFTYEGDGLELPDDDATLSRDAAAALSNALVAKVQDFGLPADRIAAGDETPPPPIGKQSILLVRGSFLELDDGSGFKRIIFGFGIGASLVESRVRLYFQTAQGERFLREFSTTSKSGRMPGLLPPIGIGAATGRLLMSAIVSTVGAVAKRGDDAVGGSVRTANKIAEELEKLYKEKGWQRR